MRGEPPAAQNSGNKTILEEYIGIAFVVANSLILLITFAVGIAANIFVILAVYRKKSLQTSNNALVVNLAVIDILRCVVDCPVLLTIIITVYQRGHASLLLCDTQVASFSFSCCIQLLTLACISAERYQAIAQPFKTSQRRRRIMVSIPLTWTLAIPVAVLCLMYVKDSPVHVKCQGSQRKTLSYDTFGLYMLLPLWAACFSVIIGFYTRIFILLKAHNRKIFDKGTFPLPKTNKTEDKPIKEETTAVENGIKNPGESQTLDASITQREAVTQVEPNSFKKDSASTLLTPTAPQSTSIGSENQKASNNILEVIELDREQPHPPAMQAGVQAGKKTFQTQKSNLCAVTAEAKPSNRIAADSVKSSTSKLQTMSNNSDSEKQPQENVKIDKLSFEMNQASLCVASTPQSDSPESISVPQIKMEPAKNSNTGEAQTTATGDQVSSLPPVSNNAPETEATQQNMDVEGAVCMMPSRASKDRANKKKESKMAKRAGYIIFTFLLFWLPLITTITVNFVLNKNKNTQIQVIQELEILSVSVSCITSLSDPIIYAAVNPQFRAEFYQLRNKIKSIFNAK